MALNVVLMQFLDESCPSASRQACHIGLLPDMQNCGLRMHRVCRERFFFRHRLQKKPLVSDSGIHHGTYVMHVP